MQGTDPVTKARADAARACSEREPAFDVAARLAALVSGCPLALVTLVGEDQQYLLGFAGPWSTPWTPSLGSPCDLVVEENRLVVIEDPRSDARLRAAPLVRSEPFIEFFAGVPVHDSRGDVLGTVAVADTRTRAAEYASLRGLEDVASVVASLIAGRQAAGARLDSDTSLTAQLARYESLAAAGALAVGVGHEINSPLTYLLGNIEHALYEIRALNRTLHSLRTSELLDTLETARQGAARIREIARGLRAFGRSETQIVPTDVRAAIELARQTSQHEVAPRASLTLALADLPLVRGDEARLCQVFVNLLVNAGQCFPASDPRRNQITVRGRQEGMQVVIDVEDNGPGISGEILPKIFEPFFTTKPFGQGTGLGLSLCRSVLASLGGTLTCESTLGRGSRFRVTLDISRDEATNREITPPPLANDGRVLVIEDDPLLLQSIRRWLERDGLIVRGESDPLRALALLTSEPFDLVLCDMMMPYMTGPELYQRAMRHDRPSPRFVFMSGGLSPTFHDSDEPRLEKPFSSQDLRRIVRRFLSLDRLE